MKQYIKSIDSIRTIAILSVLLIHTTTRTLEASKFDLTGSPFTVFLNQITRFAVPLFFMISGFVLETNSTHNSGYLTFLKKRFSKIFIPYVFWSAIYYLFVYNQNHEHFLSVIVKGNASYQLYFIPTLCIFYLFFPLLHKLYKIISNKWFLILLTVSQVWLLRQDYFIEEFTFHDPVHFAILGYFYFIIGIVAAGNIGIIKAFVRKWKYILLPATVITGVYVFWEGISRYLSTGNYLSYYSQWRPSVLIYTVLVGLTLYYIFEKPRLQFSFLERLSKLSFLVFLIHVIVLEKVWALFGKSLFDIIGKGTLGKIIIDPVFFAVTAGVSFLVAYFLHKIPYLYRITG